jgi:hypothetical protein
LPIISLLPATIVQHVSTHAVARGEATRGGGSPS